MAGPAAGADAAHVLKTPGFDNQRASLRHGP
jgi:hypothetical protein